MHAADSIPSRLFALALVAALAGAAGCRMVADHRNADGVRLYQQANYQAAMQRFQSALQANPRNADAYYNMAATVHRYSDQTNDPSLRYQAESLYQQCLQLNPNHVDCNRGLAVLYVGTNRAEQAFALIRNWTARNPQSADARVELARLYEEFGDTATAEMHLQQALPLDLSNPRTHLALARLKERSGDYGQALANYQRAQAISPGNPLVAERIASLQRTAPLSAGGFPGVGSSPAWPTAAAGSGVAAQPRPNYRY